MDRPYSRAVEFVYTPLFESTRKKPLTEEDLHHVETLLLENPDRGSVETGTGGVRKMRFALPGTGKSGGARIVYLHVPEAGRVYMLFAFPKSKKASLTDAERVEMKKLAEFLKEDR